MKKLIVVLNLVFLHTLIAVQVYAQCLTNGMLNPVTEVAWQEMFPVIIAGVDIMPATNGGIGRLDSTRTHSANGGVFCACGTPVPRLGLVVGISEVVATGDVVEDAMCMATLGTKMPTPASSPMLRGFAQKGGSDPAGTDKGSRKIFSFVHISNFNPMLIMGMFVDILKMSSSSSSSLSLPYFSEIMPTSRNSETANFFFPENLLLSNPITVASCVGDSVLTIVGSTADGMFWCAGGHSVFPTSHFTVEGNSYQDAQDIQIFKAINVLHRNNPLAFSSTAGTPAVTSCGLPVVLPYPVKSELKFQRAKPIPNVNAHRIGTPSPLWNTPTKDIQGTTVTLIWQRQDFCAL